MLFYPSESLIIGLFLLAGLFYFLAFKYNQILIGVIETRIHLQLKGFYVRNIWAARLFLLLALIMGFISSLLPLEY